jgi:uracil-DNA glycosylase
MDYKLENVIKNVNNNWKPFFEENKEMLEKILDQVIISSKQNTIFPFPEDVFKSLEYFGPMDVRLIILGQDPYIGSETIDGKVVPQAHGLSFSVPSSHKKIPPSLKNIFKEIGMKDMPKNGCLLRWVEQENMLLLNSALTVIEGKSNSHQHLWAPFTDKLIEYVGKVNQGTIFLLMGNFAIGKNKLIDSKKHKVFTCAHPSPLSAKLFFGCNVFNQINEYLVGKDLPPIKW